MAIGTGPTSKLCRWVCATRYEDLPAEIRKETVSVLYDQVGGMIASATLPSCQPLVNLLRKLDSRGECSIVGHPVHTSIVNAALANGTIAHGDEVDATGQHGTGHYACVPVAVSLTVGQYVGVSGKELCRALALGSEVVARCQRILRQYEARKQFVGSVDATMGAAVSAGSLLGLNAEQLENALGLAASCACGLSSCHVEELHQTKSLIRGKAAEAGVLSALLAQEGYHGPMEIMTIENGFFDAFVGVPSAGHEVVEGLGDNYLQKIAYKRYPVGGPNQTPLYAFLQIIKTHKLAADDIEQIEVSVSRATFQTVTTNKHPSIHMETILSLAAVYGEITFSHIHDPRYCADPRYKAFREKTRISITPRAGAATRAQKLEMGLITVRTRNGEILRQEELQYPLMSAAEVQQKFRFLAGLRLDGNRVVDLERKLMDIEAERNIASLVRELELPYCGSA